MSFLCIFRKYNWKVAEVKPLAPLREQTGRLPRRVAPEGWVGGRKAWVGMAGRVAGQKGGWSPQVGAGDGGRWPGGRVTVGPGGDGE